jgi:putative endonuclease
MELRRDVALHKNNHRMLRRSPQTKPSLYNKEMHSTYVLESFKKDHWYVGVTNNLHRRISEHNRAAIGHTKKYQPWILRLYVTFESRKRAEEAEKYFKSHSGRAFMKKHFSS